MSIPTIVRLQTDARYVLVERVFDELAPQWMGEDQRTQEYYVSTARHTVGVLRLPSTNGSTPPRCFGVPCETNGVYAHTTLSKSPNGSTGRVLYEWHELPTLEQIAATHDRTRLSFENEHDRIAIAAYAAAYGSGSASGSTSSPSAPNVQT